MLKVSRLKLLVFFFQAEDCIRDRNVTGVQTCALPICQPGLYYFSDRQRLPEAASWPHLVQHIYTSKNSPAGSDSWMLPYFRDSVRVAPSRMRRCLVAASRV